MTSVIQPGCGAEWGSMGPHDDVRHSGGDRLLTAWAQIGFDRAIATHRPHHPEAIRFRGCSLHPRKQGARAALILIRSASHPSSLARKPIDRSGYTSIRANRDCRMSG